MANLDNSLKEIAIKPEKINITAKEAVKIANTNKCLKDSFFKEQVKKNMKYGYIGFSKFGVKKVIYHEVTAKDEKGRECYHERNAWYIKVLEGEWGATKYKDDPNTGEKIPIEDWDGYFTLVPVRISTASLISSMVDMPVERITGNPFSAILRRYGKLVISPEGILK